MFPTIQDRLKTLQETRVSVTKGAVTFDPTADNFGFKRLKQLFESSLYHIKGFPCTAFNSFPDEVRYGIKVVPLLKPWAVERHPALLEGIFLHEFRSVVDERASPHIAYCFDTMLVPNNVKAMCRFPLKGIRRNVHNVSNVLFTEFVEGGAVESWLEDDNYLSLEQWRYIIFAIVWTLTVLENKYLFMHTDTHLGNVLLDVNIDDDPVTYQYVLKENGKEGKEGKESVFNVKNVGILPKLWDFEHSDVYDLDALPCAYKNRVWENKDGILTEDDVPHDFRPHYDLHFFLMSVLHVDDLPTEVADLILSTYDDHVIPGEIAESMLSGTSDGDCPSGCSCGDGDSEGDAHQNQLATDESESTREEEEEESDTETETSDETDTSDVYYYTDESFSESGDDSASEDEGDEGDEGDGDEGEEYKHCETCRCSETNWVDEEDQGDQENGDDNSDDTLSKSNESGYRSSRQRTPYLLGSRLLNGTEKQFDFPTPRQFLDHPFFDSYRVPLTKSKNRKKVEVFSYEMKERSANAGQNDAVYANVRRQEEVQDQAMSL